MQDLGREITGRQHGGHGELRPDEFWAVKDVSFELKRGECLGLIGRNGAGKTTLLKILNGLIKPDRGRIEMRGRIGALIALGAGFNPILTGRENIYINASILGLTKNEIDKKINGIIDFAEIDKFIDAPVQTYSSGMVVRLGFSVATTLKPDIIILDEVLAVGDANFRSKCWRRIGEISREAAVILVSHEAYAISRICDRGVVLEHGQTLYDGGSDEALAFYAKRSTINSVKKINKKNTLVQDFEIIPISKIIKAGDNFSFNLIITMKESATVDHAVINITDRSEDVYAQSILSFPNGSLKEGENKLLISIKNLFLPKNSYTLTLMLSTSGGKAPLIQSRNEIEFEIDSHISYGPKYYPLGCVEPLSLLNINH